MNLPLLRISRMKWNLNQKFQRSKSVILNSTLASMLFPRIISISERENFWILQDKFNTNRRNFTYARKIKRAIRNSSSKILAQKFPSPSISRLWIVLASKECVIKILELYCKQNGSKCFSFQYTNFTSTLYWMSLLKRINLVCWQNFKVSRASTFYKSVTK